MSLLFNIKEQIDIWDKQLNGLADRLFENPFMGTVVFVILLVIGLLAVKTYANRNK